MNHDKALRQHLVKLLQGGDAHAVFDEAVEGLAENLRGVRPDGAEHSPWEELEHMRIAQWDMLEFSRNPKHISPDFPAGYWPATQAPPNAQAWEKSAQSFRHDLREFCELAVDESIDLFARIPHGEGQTILREVLVTADHNSYHLGQLILLRRLLGAWK
jgi:hypothetical protein